MPSDWYNRRSRYREKTEVIMSDTHRETHGDFSPDHTEPRLTANEPLGTTASDTFALACELTALAVEDERERAAAVDSLISTSSTQTIPLPGGSRERGLTQSLPKVADAFEASSTDDDEEAQGRVLSKKSRLSKGKRVALAALGVLALVVAVGAGLFFFLGGPALLAKPDVRAVQAALEADADVMDGYASNDYVTPDAYRLSDVQMGSVQAQDDGSALVDATAVLRNKFFESSCSFMIKFARVADAPRFSEFHQFDLADRDSMDWVGAVITDSAQTRAIAPVAHDPEFSGKFAPTFDEDAQTCTATASDTIDLWFGARIKQTVYTYAFNGTAWTRKKAEPSEKLTIDAAKLEGTYAGQGDAARLTGVKIANFDAAAGTFTIEYAATTGGLAPQNVSGVLDCTFSITPATEANASYRQTDGYVYAFSGTGTSNGGKGTARIEGVLGLDGAIAVDFTGDYTKPAFLFGGATDESMTISGSIARAS